jgi:hypothetical protein
MNEIMICAILRNGSDRSAIVNRPLRLPLARESDVSGFGVFVNGFGGNGSTPQRDAMRTVSFAIVEIVALILIVLISSL